MNGRCISLLSFRLFPAIARSDETISFPDGNLVVIYTLPEKDGSQSGARTKGRN